MIRGATLYDGTGAGARLADVGVTGGVIEAVGDLSHQAAGASVDASGLALAPGFIDVHSHDDFAVFLTPDMDFKLLQGVTTDVVGNCGLGPAPFEEARRYLGFFGAADRSATLPEWSDHGGYLDAVDRDPPSCNVAVLVGHGTIRLAAMRNDRRPASDGERASMCEMLEEGIAAGAVGFSSGLIYEPGRYAPTEELVALAASMAGSGALYATHMREEGSRLIESVTEALRIGSEGGVAVQISHHKASGRENWGRVKDSLALIDAARSGGLDVTADQYPYTAGSTSLFAVMQNLRDPPGGGPVQLDGSEVVVASTPAHPEWEGRSLSDIGVEMGCSWQQAADAILDGEGLGAVVVMHTMSLDDVRTVLAHPSTMIGSDGVPTLGGKPHPRLYGTFARVLGTFVRDERVLTLAEAIHRMTGMPAAKFGLAGRGVIAPGAAGDLVAFDPSTIEDVATYDEPRRSPVGVRHVWVNGTPVVRDGAHTGARPGRAVRRGQRGHGSRSGDRG